MILHRTHLTTTWLNINIEEALDLKQFESNYFNNYSLLFDYRVANDDVL